ncbi:MAG TPA: HXXEE domain-containing protein [Anaerolineales bacterium]|nr:HXXEE domain-containing protein [Anaerolineales bacterium]
MMFLNSISFERLLWLVPVFLTIHNMEEAPFMESWYKRLPLKLPLAITKRQFMIAVIFITLAGFVVTYFGVEYLANRTGYLIVLGMQAMLLFNAFVPHIATTIRFRMYSPGVVTAMLIMLPFSFYLFRRAFDENILGWTQFWMLLGIAPFAVVLIALLSLRIGKAFDNKAA